MTSVVRAAVAGCDLGPGHTDAVSEQVAQAVADGPALCEALFLVARRGRVVAHIDLAPSQDHGQQQGAHSVVRTAVGGGADIAEHAAVIDGLVEVPVNALDVRPVGTDFVSGGRLGAVVQVGYVDAATAGEKQGDQRAPHALTHTTEGG